MNSDNVALWKTQHNNAEEDCFKILILREALKTQHQHPEEFLCIFGSQTFVPISWMCKKQTSVSHSSTEAEVISLDAGLRMDGIPALDLWEFVIEVFHSPPNQINKSKDQESQGNLSRNTTLHMKNQNPTEHVGHFVELDQRRKFTEIVLINQMETGTRLLNEGCSTLQKAVILYFVPAAP